VSGNGYFVNTTSGAITVTLPAGSAGDIVGISDYASTFQTNSVTITPNGTDKINGVNADAILLTKGIAVSLVYVDDTRGWKSVTGSDNDTTGLPPYIEATGGTITCCGDYKIHTFTGPGTFTVTRAAVCASDNTVSYLVSAGGGGAGGDQGGGGGAGGFREYKNSCDSYTASPLNGNPGGTAVTVTATSYPITVGGGGGGGSGGNGCLSSPGVQGSNSVFSTITSTGGGGGGSNAIGGRNGNPGGSGGGERSACNGVGTGNTPPVNPPQGTPGATNAAGKGGGGAISTGPGGGATTGITGSPVSYSCGSVPSGISHGGVGGGDDVAGGNGGGGTVIIRYRYQ